MEAKKAREDLLALRRANLNVNWPGALRSLQGHKGTLTFVSLLGDSFFKTLDSNMKRNTAFIKKVAKISEETKDKICAEMLTLNLTRYVSELVAAIADAKLKNTDVGAVVQVGDAWPYSPPRSP